VFNPRYLDYVVSEIMLGDTGRGMLDRRFFSKYTT